MVPGVFPSQTLRKLVASSVKLFRTRIGVLGGNWEGFAGSEDRLVSWAGQRVPLSRVLT